LPAALPWTRPLVPPPRMGPALRLAAPSGTVRYSSSLEPLQAATHAPQPANRPATRAAPLRTLAPTLRSTSRARPAAPPAPPCAPAWPALASPRPGLTLPAGSSACGVGGGTYTHAHAPHRPLVWRCASSLGGPSGQEPDISAPSPASPRRASHVHAHACTRARTHTHTHTSARKHTYRHTHAGTHTHTLMHVRPSTHRHEHTRTHTRTTKQAPAPP
jgi:hypothetical protein